MAREMPRPSAIARGTVRWGRRVSPARSMAVRNPSRENRMPPLLMAVTMPCRVWAGAWGMARRLPQWPEASIRVIEISRGMASFQAVSPSIQRASQPTPARLIQASTTSRAVARASPGALSTWPAPPWLEVAATVSQGKLLARYCSTASTSMVGRAR